MAENNILKALLTRRAGGLNAEEPAPSALPGLTAGKSVTIAAAGRQDKSEKVQLYTNFEGVDGNGLIIVGTPIHRGGLFEIPAGEKCAVTYIDASDIYSIKCCVKQHVSKDNLHYTLLERAGEVEEVERRTDFRLPVSLPCSITRYVDNGEDELVTVCHDAKMLDISAGGVRIITVAPLAQGEEIGCTVALGEHGQKDLALAVRWVEPLARNNADMFAAGLQFISLRKPENDTIVRYIYGEQLKRRMAERTNAEAASAREYTE